MAVEQRKALHLIVADDDQLVFEPGALHNDVRNGSGSRMRRVQARPAEDSHILDDEWLSRFHLARSISLLRDVDNLQNVAVVCADVQHIVAFSADCLDLWVDGNEGVAIGEAGADNDWPSEIGRDCGVHQWMVGNEVEGSIWQ